MSIILSSTFYFGLALLSAIYAFNIVSSKNREGLSAFDRVADLICFVGALFMFGFMLSLGISLLVEATLALQPTP